MLCVHFCCVLMAAMLCADWLLSRHFELHTQHCEANQIGPSEVSQSFINRLSHTANALRLVCDNRIHFPHHNFDRSRGSCRPLVLPSTLDGLMTLIRLCDCCRYVPLYLADKQAFLKESARLQPPVGELVVVAGADSTHRLTGDLKRDLEIKSGSMGVLWIPNANKDPKVTSCYTVC